VSELVSPKPKNHLDQLRDAIRIKHYSYSTEKTCVHWAKRFILFYDDRHTWSLGTNGVLASIAYLANECQVSASSCSQAPDALHS